MDRDPDSPPGREAFLSPMSEYWNVPLMRDSEIIERPADQNTLTRRYTEEANRFIESNQDRPFFVYLAHSMAHVPLFASTAFEGSSRRGLYGDVMEEIDWSVGQILSKLRELGLERNTVVLFTSDNGPWLTFDQQGGSAGLLRGGKGETYEGGMRVPTIFWGPGIVQPGVVAEMGSTLDVFLTYAALAEATVPFDLSLDSADLSPALKGEGPSPRRAMFFYRGTEIFAVRRGPFKAHFLTQSGYGGDPPARQDPPLLFHLEHDPSEKYDIAEDFPEVVEALVELAERFPAEVEPVPNQLENRLESDQ
jgi:arylsulfatase A-like enzyme